MIKAEKKGVVGGIWRKLYWESEVGYWEPLSTGFMDLPKSIWGASIFFHWPSSDCFCTIQEEREKSAFRPQRQTDRNRNTWNLKVSSNINYFCSGRKWFSSDNRCAWYAKIWAISTIITKGQNIEVGYSTIIFLTLNLPKVPIPTSHLNQHNS